METTFFSRNRVRKKSFLVYLFSYPHVVPSRSSKRLSFLGADFRFWSWLGLTRNENVKSRIKVVPTLPVYLSSPRTLLPGPHPTHISLPPSSPYPLPPLSTSNYFLPSRSWQIRHETRVVSGRFFWIRQGTKSYPCRISENRDLTKVISTISALSYALLQSFRT